MYIFRLPNSSCYPTILQQKERVLIMKISVSLAVINLTGNFKDSGFDQTEKASTTIYTEATVDVSNAIYNVLTIFLWKPCC